jgi:hypothetical protein
MGDQTMFFSSDLESAAAGGLIMRGDDKMRSGEGERREEEDKVAVARTRE